MPREPTTTPTLAAARRAAARGPAPARPHPRVLVAVGAGGALGGIARYEIAAAWPAPAGGFPWSTWAVNVSGALLLGVVVTLVVERWPPTRYVRPFAAIGFCGAYTTWSTFMTETVLRVRDHRVALAVVYVSASLLAGLAATYAGVWAARRRAPRGRGSA